MNLAAPPRQPERTFLHRHYDWVVASGEASRQPWSRALRTPLERVVVLGNGIAGVTAADHVRRRHPACSVDIVADESHHLYNRMGISRLIYGRSAMQGLYLNPDSWYEERNITTWLNTQARRIDRAGRPARRPPPPSA